MQNPLPIRVDVAKSVTAVFEPLPIVLESVKSDLAGPTLTWNNLAWATIYRIYRGTTSVPSSAEVLVEIPNVGECTYLDATGEPDQLYWYWVEAEGLEESAMSDPMTGRKGTPVVFSPITYENLQGATHENPEVYEEGKLLTLTMPSSVPGYVFSGWVPAQITTEMTGSQTVRATWTPHTYTITYSANGGSGTMQRTSATYGESITLPKATFVKDGFYFRGWATEVEGRIIYPDGATVSNLTTEQNGVVNLFAVWGSSNATPEEFFVYERSGESVSIKGFQGMYPEDIIVPSTIEGLPVSSIFLDQATVYEQLKSITFPDAYTELWCFEGENFPNLESVFFKGCPYAWNVSWFPETAIGYYPARYAEAWLSEIDENGRVCNLKMQLWEDEVVTPEDITLSLLNFSIINDGVVITGLKKANYSGALIIPEKFKGDPVTSIGSNAFYNCSGLTSVTIPSSVTTIGSNAFSGCTGLTSVTIPSGVNSIGDGAFSGVAPETLTASLLWLPSGMLKDNLKTLIILEGVTSIGGRAFYGCSSLTSVTIPSSVTSIEEWAFASCTSLTTVTISEGVTSIGWHAFNGCTGLASVTIPEGVTSIGVWAFHNCSSLTTVTIPSSVTSIGVGAFDACFSLISFNVVNGNSNYSAINGLLCSKDGKTLLACPPGLATVTIPSSVTSIGSDAFCNCSGLTSVTIPSSVTSIGSDAFRGCDNLTSVRIPSSVTEIGYAAFVECPNLESVTFSGLPLSGYSDGWIFSDATGYYLPKHAEAWAEVINEDGKWCGLTMKVYEGGDAPDNPNPDEPNPDEPTVPESPSWVAPENYQNTMTIYAQVKDTTADAFIEAEGSLLAAFDAYGNCRGVKSIQAGPKCKLYQLSVASNTTAGEVLTLKVWNATTGETIDIAETISFVSDGKIGSLPAPKVYTVGQTSLELQFKKGWNWFSINLELPADITLSEVFKDWVPANEDIVKSATETATYYDGVWYPEDFALVPGKMYQVKNSNDESATICLTGAPVPLTTEIAVKSGWNWLGYMGKTAADVAVAFTDDTLFTDEDLLKSGTASATYYEGQWYGDLKLEPGKGYKLSVANATTLKYAEATPVSTMAAASLLAVDSAPTWVAEERQYTMTVYAAVQNGAGKAFEAEGCLLGAFSADGVCHGKGVQPIRGPKGMLYQLNVGSDTASGEVFTLKLWDAESGQVYDIEQTVTFVSDGRIGSIVNPQVYTAIVTANSFTVTVDVVGNGTITGTGDYAADETVTLTATPSEGYLFCGWSTTPVIMDATYSFTMPEAAVSVTAYFAPVAALNAYVNGQGFVSADAVNAKIQAYVEENNLKTPEEVEAAIDAHVAENGLLTPAEANQQTQDYIVANKLMSKEEAKQELLDDDEVFTEDEMKALALGAPVIKVKDGVATVSIQVQKASELNGEWEVVEDGEVSVEITPKAGEKAGFYKFVVPNKQ